VNRDGRVNLADLLIVFKALGTRSGEPGWNPAADVNGDLSVDWRDASIVIKNMGCGGFWWGFWYCCH
jgi:hypothetical protein